RFTPRARALDLDLERLDAMFLRLAPGVLRGHLGGIGRRLARALEAHGAGRRPGDGIALDVRDQDLGVVEGRIYMRHAGGDVLAFLALHPRDFGITSHGSAAPLLLLAGDRLGRALAGAGIGVGALAANRQVLAVTQAAI